MARFPLRLAVVALFLTGCTGMCGKGRSGLTPEQVVESYLDVALNIADIKERETLLSYTTGNLKSAIESASPETIKTAYIDRKYKILNYSVIERRDRTPRETEITFQLTYNDLGTGTPQSDETPKVTTENTVSVVKEKGIWLIRDVLGHKTSIDFPVSEESRITAKAGVITPIDPPAPETPTEPAAPNPGPAP